MENMAVMAGGIKIGRPFLLCTPITFYGRRYTTTLEEVTWLISNGYEPYPDKDNPKRILFLPTSNIAEPKMINFRAIHEASVESNQREYQYLLEDFLFTPFNNMKSKYLKSREAQEAYQRLSNEYDYSSRSRAQNSLWRNSEPRLKEEKSGFSNSFTRTTSEADRCANWRRK